MTFAWCFLILISTTHCPSLGICLAYLSLILLFSLPISKKLVLIVPTQSLQISVNPNNESKQVSLFENELTEKNTFFIGLGI